MVADVIPSVANPYLESTLLGACPGLRESWSAHRRTFIGADEPDDGALLDAVRRHVVELVLEERLAEFSRFVRTIERVLGEADPMLELLLRETLLVPLAADVAAAGIPRGRIDPYLGRRTALAWPSER